MPAHPPASTRENCAYPLQVGGYGWATVNWVKRLESAVKRLITTPKGSLLWAPTYGTTLHLLRTQGMTVDTAMNSVSRGSTMELVKSDLTLAFRQWLPDVALDGLQITADGQRQSMEVKIAWSMKQPPRGQQKANQVQVITTVVV